ncbi:aminotransferase-like domain-containing protein [Deinococcus aquiradiocola]|uniref:Transcriptional regulator n=1 Tax=Deinococcus aquiradiocola TaxID=393059 RepID=A0A917UME0_9DEIO|nr:PLP-dependent aminotransferase family protein [Deinococcus aquiradiocola]GGJ67996.1 transcriptional regulator [Deinococcus aquiradiocola]
MKPTQGEPQGSVRILEALRALLEQEYRPGDRLPSVRDLTRQYQASPVTVSAALTRLVGEGRIVTQPGRGTFVAQVSAPTPVRDVGWQTVALSETLALPGEMQTMLSPTPAGLIPLGSGYTDESLHPADLLHRTAASAARRPGIWSRLPPEGLEALRTWFAQQLGPEHRPEDLLIAPGGQAALSTALRALVPPGAPLLVESPTYYGVLAAARTIGARLIPVPTDTHGIRPDLLHAAFRASGARVLYLQPLYANPTGAVLSPERRAEVIRAAEEAGAFIVEDDYARDLNLHGTPPPPLAVLAPDRVVYLRSITKSTAPGLRVAAIAALGPVRTRLRNARAVEDYFLSGPIQETALQVLTSRIWPRHLQHLRGTLRGRRDVMRAALARHLPHLQVMGTPAGGFNLWVRLPDHTDDLTYVADAARQGVQVSAGRNYFPAEPDGSYVRLSYAACSAQRIEDAVLRLAAVPLHSA